MAKARKEKPATTPIISGRQKAAPGHRVMTVCSTCPMGQALVRTVARRVKKELGLK
jgi:hypothetical protein